MNTWDATRLSEEEWRQNKGGQEVTARAQHAKLAAVLMPLLKRATEVAGSADGYILCRTWAWWREARALAAEWEKEQHGYPPL